MKIIICIVALIVSTHNGRAQDSEINEIRARYISWLDGSEVDYSRPEVMTRYDYIISNYAWASNYTSFDFDDPGAPWDLTASTDKNELKGITARLIELCIIYSIEGPIEDPNIYFEQPDVLETIFSVFDFIEAKGLDGDTYFGDYYYPGSEVYGLGGTAIIRSASYGNSILLLRDELLATGRLDIHMEALDNFSFYWSPENPVFDFVWKGTNADGIKSIGQCRLIYILCQEDGEPSRVANMDHYLAFLNNALGTAPGWADMIKPDYMTYHHRGAYPSNYGATAIMAASSLQWILDGSEYEINEESSNNIREVLLAYRKYTLGYSMPSMLTGRFPTNTESLVTLTYAFANAYLSNPIDNLECGQEFTRLFNMDATSITDKLIKQRGVSVSLYHTLGGAQIMVDVLDEELDETIVLNGQFSFPYAGLTIHKEENWMISQKGTSKHIWHYEGTPSQNAFGRYSSAGYMEILTNNASYPRQESGLSWNGYEWTHRPGTTVNYLTNDEIYDEVNDDRSTNSKDFLVNASYDNYGAFGLDYEDINTEDLMSVKKSSFFFDDYILCLTNNANNVDGIHNVHSTIFQTKINDLEAYMHIETDSVNGLDYLYTTEDENIGFTDAVNNAYFLKETGGDQLTIKRELQNSISPNGSSPTEGNFAQAWIDHGTNPLDLGLVYAIQVNGGKNGMDNLIENFDELFTVHVLDDFIHVVEYLVDSTVGITAFQENDEINQGHIKGVDNAGIIFTTPLEDGNKLKLGFTDPNLGLMDDDEWYPYNAFPLSVYYQEPNTHEVTVVVIGEWELESGSDNISLFFNGTDTELTFTTKNGLSEVCVLKKPDGDLSIDNSVFSSIKVYPTITDQTIYLKGELSQVKEIILLSINGQVADSWQLEELNGSSIDLANMDSGIYNLVIITEENRQVTKIIKM